MPGSQQEMELPAIKPANLTPFLDVYANVKNTGKVRRKTHMKVKRRDTSTIILETRLMYLEWALK